MILPTLLLAAALSQPLPVLSLQDALSQAEQQNPDLGVARARLRQADTLTAQAWSGYLPEVAAQGSFTRNNTTATLSLPTRFGVRETGVQQGAVEDPQNPGTTPTTQIAVPVEVISVPIQVQNQWGGQVSLRQSLLVPELFPAIRNAYLAQRSTQLTAENARREILFGVTRAYLGASALRESIAVQEELLNVRKGFEKDAQTRFTMGDVAKTAVLRAQLDRSQAEQELVRARNAYASARSGLAALLARPLDFDVIRPADTELSALEKGTGSQEPELDALEHRLDLAASRVGVDLAYGTRRRVITRYLPSLVGTGNYLISNVAGFTGQNTNWNVGLGLRWMIFDGGLREAQLREASAKISEAKESERSTEEKVKDEVRRAEIDLETAQATLAKATEQVTVARETAQLAKQNFTAGVATYLEVSDANSALSRSELAAVSEALNLRLARISLSRSMGQFNPLPH